MGSTQTPHYLRLFLFGLMAVAFTMGAGPEPATYEIALASNSEENATSTAASEENTPSIEYALDKVSQAQTWQTLLGLTNNVQNTNCVDCLKAVPSSRYMSCNSKNDYMERELVATSQRNSLLGAMVRIAPSSKSIIKPLCIEMGMTQKFGLNSKNFRSCDGNGRLTGAIRPCISENYFRVTHNSFDLVSSCMMGQVSPGEDLAEQKKDVRAAYAMINIESGFHMNAMSGTGAGGIGQFTGSAIEDVNRNEMRAIRIGLEDSQDPRCVQMSHEMLDSIAPMRPDSKNSCDRVSLSRGNPMKNMIYTYAYLKGVKRSMNRLIFKNASYSPKFKKLSISELNKIKRALMVWSHNSGPSGAWTPAKALLNTVYRNRPVTNADEFINQMQAYMGKFPASANSSVSRRKETSRYFPEITKTLTQIENNVGGGTCVN